MTRRMELPLTEMGKTVTRVFCGLNYVSRHPFSYVEVLIPRILECDLVWKEDCCRCELRWGHPGVRWPLIWSDQCPWLKGKMWAQTCTGRTVSGEKAEVDNPRNDKDCQQPPPAARGLGHSQPQKEPTWWWVQTVSLCWLGHHVCGTLSPQSGGTGTEKGGSGI